MTEISPIKAGRYIIRLAQSANDIAMAQRLRYRVFVEEMGAETSFENHALKQEKDDIDDSCDHLLLEDTEGTDPDPLNRIIGVYRIQRMSSGSLFKSFCAEKEFDIERIKLFMLENPKIRSIELGRSCIAQGHRSGLAAKLLLMGLSHYIAFHNIQMMFGCASFSAKDINALELPLSYLHHNYLSRPELRAKARPEHALNLTLLPAEAINPTRAFKMLPPMLKTYLRVNGTFGEGAYLDKVFRTVDVFVIAETRNVPSRISCFLEKLLKDTSSLPIR